MRWTPVIVTAASVAVGVGIVLSSQHLWAYPKLPTTYPPDEPPLRPPPPGEPIPNAPSVPDGPPGPLATRLAELLDDQTDNELARARAAMPAAWWGYILAATRAPNDEIFAIVLNPTLVDLYVMTEQERSALEDAIVSAIGVWDASRLRDILIDARATV